MKLKFLFGALCLMPMAANADIAYRVEQTYIPADSDVLYDPSFAAQHRFYVGSMYNFAMWDEFTDDANVYANGKNTSSFEIVAGVRATDTFRLEANYIRTDAEYDTFSLTGDTVMLNAIFDARIDSVYRVLRTQSVIPYIGVGAGLSWNTAKAITIAEDMSPAVAMMAGVAFELGEHFAIDLGYRYFYMFSPKFDSIKDLTPTANQFRAGVRINF